MPYRKRYQRRRKRPAVRYRSRPANLGYMSYLKYVPSLLTKVKYLASMINSETHIYDSDPASSSISNTGSVLAITSGIAQGDTNASRTGNTVLAKSLYTLGNVVVNSAMTSLGVQCRLIWFIHKRATGATPAVTDILLEASIESPIKIGVGDQIKILKDKSFTLTSTKPIVPVKEFFDFRGQSLHQKWVASAEEENHIYLLWISTEASNPPSIDIYNRFRFYDN